jgi:hypothetical protein
MGFKDFETFVKDIPNNCVVRVRIADNVLDDEDWDISELIINDGLVVSQRLVHPGVYGIEDMVGWSVDELSAWSSYDGTGHMPENFQEVSLGPNLPNTKEQKVWEKMRTHCDNKDNNMLKWCKLPASGWAECKYENCPILKGLI